MSSIAHALSGSDPHARRVLIVDDDANTVRALGTILSDEGFEVYEAGNGEEALERLRDIRPDAVLLDVCMTGMDGIELLRRARDERIDSCFLVMTAHAKVESAVKAMRAGAEDYITKPIDVAAVLARLDKAFEKVRLVREVQALRERISEKYQFSNMVGDAPEFQVILDIVKRAAPTRATVLILGEPGTGKELMARALHQASPRAAQPFIKVNCAALSETLLESELFRREKGSFAGAVAKREGSLELGNEGTIFFDEIGDLSPAVQAKLLRVLQQHEVERIGGRDTIEVDVRVVAASNRDLASDVRAGRFREDLYYAINVVSVTLPPLRYRKTDIPQLVAHFVDKYNFLYGKRVRGMAPGIMQTLVSYDWPGNVRELGNVIERAVVLGCGDDVTSDDLPAALRGPHSNGTSRAALIPGASMYDIEREAILRTLEFVDGSTARAAQVLGMSVRKVQYRLKEYVTRTSKSCDVTPTAS